MKKLFVLFVFALSFTSCIVTKPKNDWYEAPAIIRPVEFNPTPQTPAKKATRLSNTSKFLAPRIAGFTVIYTFTVIYYKE